LLLEGPLAGAQVDLIPRIGVEEVVAGPAGDRVAVVPVRSVDEVVAAATKKLVGVGGHLILHRVVPALAHDRVVTRSALEAPSPRGAV
jgi:hypothetical protein